MRFLSREFAFISAVKFTIFFNSFYVLLLQKGGGGRGGLPATQTTTQPPSKSAQVVCAIFYSSAVSLRTQTYFRLSFVSAKDKGQSERRLRSQTNFSTNITFLDRLVITINNLHFDTDSLHHFHSTLSFLVKFICVFIALF